MPNFESLLRKCFDLQNQATALWHSEEAYALYPTNPPSPQTLLDLVLSQHFRNFQLWHIEDQARRTDVDDSVIADCKRRIDRLNQERNDCMEQIDACLLALLQKHMPADTAQIQNTESAGMAIDRLSILSLKIWHMAEETRRLDAGLNHITACTKKLEILKEQRTDLIAALLHLISEYLAGKKRPKVYFQCKMYNDPTLNPSLYTQNP